MQTQTYKKKKGKYEPVWPKRYLGADGHWYRSISEVAIAFHLKLFGIHYKTEGSIYPGDNRKFQYDWKIVYRDGHGKKKKLFIEFFGYSGKDYYTRRKEKIKYYKKKGFDLISLEPMDLENLDLRLRKKLRSYWRSITSQDYQQLCMNATDGILKNLPSMETAHVEQIRDLADKVLQSRNDFVPVTIGTIGKFDQSKKHGAFVSLLRHEQTRKNIFAFKYIPVWNTCECKDVHVVSYLKKPDPANKNLYSAMWKLMVREGSVLVVRNNAKHQHDTKKKYLVVDGSQLQEETNRFTREISAKRAYDIAQQNTELLLEGEHNCEY